MMWNTSGSQLSYKQFCSRHHLQCLLGGARAGQLTSQELTPDIQQVGIDGSFIALCSPSKEIFIAILSQTNYIFFNGHPFPPGSLGLCNTTQPCLLQAREDYRNHFLMITLPKNPKLELLTATTMPVKIDTEHSQNYDILPENLFRQCLQCPPPLRPVNRNGRSRLARKHIMAKLLPPLCQGSSPKLTLANLSNHLKVSERTLRDIFKETLNITPHEFSRQHKLYLYRQEIESSSQLKTISEIAFSLGINSIGRTAKHYYNLFGESPNQTQKRCASTMKR